MHKSLFIKTLIVLFFSLNYLYAGKYYELNEGTLIECEEAPQHIKGVRFISSINSNIEKMTQDFIERDILLRKSLFPKSSQKGEALEVEGKKAKVNISESAEGNNTNICQMAIYSLNETNQTYLLKDDYCFYLSGTVPVQAGGKHEIEDEIIHRTFRKLYIENSPTDIIVIQRNQPILDSALRTTHHLVRVEEFITESSEEINQLRFKAKEKKEEIQEFKERDKAPLIEKAKEKMSNFLDECFSKSLQLEDFNLYLMKAKLITKGERIIDTLQKSLLDDFQNINALLTSPHFNLSCSEQLLLKVYDDETERETLVSDIQDKVEETFQDNHLKTLIIHLHSTKTPCFTCLINFCCHCQERGNIYLLLKSIRQSLSGDYSLKFLISYHVPHYNREVSQMFIPVVEDETYINENDIGLINLRRLISQEKKINPLQEATINADSLDEEELPIDLFS